MRGATMPDYAGIAAEQDAVQARIERAAAAMFKARLREIKRNVLASYRKGGTFWVDAEEAVGELSPALAGVSLTAYLTAIELTMMRAARKRAKSLNRMDDLLDQVRSRSDMTPEQRQAIEAYYGARAAGVMEGMGAGMNTRLRKVVRDIVRNDLHVKAGMAAIRKAWDREGLSPVKPYRIETAYRSEIQMAFGAGNWQAHEEDEWMRQWVWGYRYVTAGDDRVRPNHAAMDGTMLPRDHPFWNTAWTPNGYSCRCQIITVYKDEQPKTWDEPSKSVLIDGDPVDVLPDKGWAFNPGQMFRGVENAVRKGTFPGVLVPPPSPPKS